MTNLTTKQTDKSVKAEMPYYDTFVTTDRWVRDAIRKALVKKSREFYYVKSINKLVDGRYFIELEKEFKL